MCGRYTLKTLPDAIRKEFEFTDEFELAPRYNVAPSQMVPAIRLDPSSGERRLSFLKWGLIPSWAKEPGIGNILINARAETVAEKPSFRTALKKRRCLVIADGFFEWKRHDEKKVPFYFQLKDGSTFAFAGLWERWEKVDDAIESCTLITTEANGVVAPVHDRMPVILKPEDYGRWLDSEEERPERLARFLEPLPDDWMTAREVSTLVNSPRNNSSKCIKPI